MDNAAMRVNYASEVFAGGVAVAKQQVLASLPKRLSELHKVGALHIHDLEAFGKINNCCTPDLAPYFERVTLQEKTDAGVIYGLLESVKELIENLALVQSGGIGFGNFDIDLGGALEKRGICCTEQNVSALNDAVRSFVRWVNVTCTRFCREPYYVTLNIGLGFGDWDRAVSASLLAACKSAPASFTRPNIVFKVSESANRLPGSPNHDLFLQATACTAKRMVPTYLLMDGPANAQCDPLKLNIMGCRTRVYSNNSGPEGTVGRGNIGCVSINLPRIALETGNLQDFYRVLSARVEDGFAILDLRRDGLLNSGGTHMQFTLDNGIWRDVSTIEELVQQGTFSIGFIGIAEVVEVLLGSTNPTREERMRAGFEIASFMADMVQARRDALGRNYSLLASPGEMISGRFCECDARDYPHAVQEKGFYTNSFHVPVDAGMPLFEKISLEAPFHALCNGGSISYVEFASALLENADAIADAIEFASKAGTSYLGFNYPLDICNSCGHTGTFDTCDACGSADITRIRRVSGYLEDLSRFTQGKQAEVSFRKANL